MDSLGPYGHFGQALKYTYGLMLVLYDSPVLVCPCIRMLLNCLLSGFPALYIS